MNRVLLYFSMFLLGIATVMLVNSCTYSINMVHTSGHASDVVEDTENIEPTIDPTVNIP